MSIKTNITVNEESTFGLKITVRDTSSSVVVPTSMGWYLKDSLGAIVGSGTPGSLSSETYITIGNSLTLVQSGEVRKNLDRLVCIEARYTSDIFGANAIEKETFHFTLVNNPVV